MLTDAEIEILMILVRANKEWAKLAHNDDLEEKLKQICAKLDDMEDNYG